MRRKPQRADPEIYERERSRERPRKNIRNEIRAEYVPEDSNLFPVRRRRMMRPTACARVRLRAFPSEPNQRVFRRAVGRHNGQGPSRQKRELDDVREVDLDVVPGLEA